VQRLEKVLQDAGIKLSSVASQVLGVSGRAMLEALIAGSHDPELLAELAKGTLRRKLPALREALEGRFTDHHALLVSQMLAQIDFLDESVATLSQRIEELTAPFWREIELLDSIPGVDRRTAEMLLAEIGPDMSRFPSPGHLASWAGLCPGQHESAGKQRTGATRKGSRWLRGALTESAKAIVRTKGTYLSARYHRIKSRRGHAKATIATAHKILTAAYHVLDRGVPHPRARRRLLLPPRRRQRRPLPPPARPPTRAPRPQGHPRTAPGGRLTDRHRTYFRFSFPRRRGRLPAAGENGAGSGRRLLASRFSWCS
jgi:transposase